MTTDTAAAAALFNGPHTSGGGKYENVKDGLYKGTLLRLEEGPTFYDTKEVSEQYPQGKPQPKVRWVWELSLPDGTPLNEEMSELTSTATGDRSFAAAFFSAHMGRQFNNQLTTRDEAVTESLGKTVLLSVSTKPSGYRKVAVFPATN